MTNTEQRKRFALWSGLFAFAVSAGMATADVRLPNIIGSNMVLQRDVPLPIWGRADAGEEVTVKIANREAKATADAKGRWMVRLEPLPVGGPLEMTVAGRNTIQLQNILVGEVWLGSGQSNMGLGIGQVLDSEKEIAEANYPELRLFFVRPTPAADPADDVPGAWQVCTPANVLVPGWPGFSAAAYFFGRDLHKELKVPVGMIASAWGGTRIEPWTPAEAFADMPMFKDITRQIEQADANFEKALADALTKYEAWLSKARDAVEAHKPAPGPPAWPTHPLNSERSPTGLFNGMIHPLIPFAIRGAIWYQGESNHPDGARYTDMMKALVGGWRKAWGQGDFPFYYVQIAPFSHIYRDDLLPKLWEAQTAALAIPNTGMIVTTDITDLDDIHPKNKQDIGKRLVLWALARTYGRKELVCSGPLYKSMSIEGGKARLSFDWVGGGLASRDGKPLNWFEIAGEDRKFLPADATIDGASVVVSSDKVKTPTAVRFGWNQVAQPNLINKEGLPASPFRTDRW